MRELGTLRAPLFVKEMVVHSIEIFQIDAFTDKIFHGNPAAVCLLSDWLNDELMQAIAVENNLSETAFIIEDKQGFHIRWFTPYGEINLCGHATLAGAFVLFELGKYHGDALTFSSLSGPLTVRIKNNRLRLDFPSLPIQPCLGKDVFNTMLDRPWIDAFESDLDYLILMKDEETVENTRVDLKLLANLPKRGLILTAPADDADFYSRCFYPKHHIDEDPVTGSAYCILTPFWSNRLNKTQMQAIQGSFRRGDVFCGLVENRIYVSGYCKWFSKGRLVI